MILRKLINLQNLYICIFLFLLHTHIILFLKFPNSLPLYISMPLSLVWVSPVLLGEQSDQEFSLLSSVKCSWYDNISPWRKTEPLADLSQVHILVYFTNMLYCTGSSGIKLLHTWWKLKRNKSVSFFSWFEIFSFHQVCSNLISELQPPNNMLVKQTNM